MGDGDISIHQLAQFDPILRDAVPSNGWGRGSNPIKAMAADGSVPEEVSKLISRHTFICILYGAMREVESVQHFWLSNAVDLL